MSQPSSSERGSERDLELLYEVGCLRHLPRVWQQFGGPNVANVAEHTMRVMWIARVLAEAESADVAHATELALVHDLGKSRASDAHWLNRNFVKRDQAGAVAATVAGTNQERSAAALYAEFVAAETLEAKVVKDADNLDADLEFAEQRHNWPFAENQRQKVRGTVFEQKLHTEAARAMWQQIQASAPEGWYTSQYESLMKSGRVGAAEPESLGRAE